MVLQSLKDSGEAAGEVSSMYSTPNASRLCSSGEETCLVKKKKKKKKKKKGDDTKMKKHDEKLTPWRS